MVTNWENVETNFFFCKLKNVFWGGVVSEVMSTSSTYSSTATEPFEEVHSCSENRSYQP